jgi:hypothetical protein
VIFGLMRRGRGFGGVIVAHQGQHAAMLGGAGEIGMTEHIPGAIDPGAFAVPEAEHPIELALPAEFRLLRAPDRRRGDVFIEAGLETDVVFIERALRADELLVERAERRTAIARDIPRRIEAGAAVALLLHQAESNDGLEAGDEDAALGEIVFVVERDLVERHRAGLPGQCALATIRALGSVDTYSPRRRGSNAKNMSGLAISRRSPGRTGNVGTAAADVFWRTATQAAVPMSHGGLEAREVRLAEPPGVLYNRVPVPGPEIPADGCLRRPS